LEGGFKEFYDGMDTASGKLVNLLGCIVCRLEVIWGIVDHHKAFKDSTNIHATIEDAQQVLFSL
jgi:hypothetical protein